ncbi:MAG: hypothetical protein D4R95_07280 [Actinobacteria bacterium]|nr:MAG: hypothetical protein D4R95_07280 [Actinomycetota bacterium]
MYAQESNLQTAPSSVLVEKTYEPRDETSTLSIYGIDPASIKEFPTFQNQLETVIAETPAIIANELDISVSMTITRSDPQTSLTHIATDKYGKQQLTMLNVGQPNYILSCQASQEEDCNQVIEIYVKRISSARAAAIQRGIQALADQIQSVSKQTTGDISQLQLQQTALSTVLSSTTGEMGFVNERVEARSGTVSTVKASTFLFGGVFGLVLALLIILQLTIVDDEVRNERILRRRSDLPVFLGEISKLNQDADVTHFVAALIAQIPTAGNSVVFIPTLNGQTVSGLVGLCSQHITNSQITFEESVHIDEMTVDQLSAQSKTYVLVVEKNHSTIHNVKRSSQVLSRSNNRILGLVLVSSSI